MIGASSSVVVVAPPPEGEEPPWGRSPCFSSRGAIYPRAARALRTFLRVERSEMGPFSACAHLSEIGCYA